MTQDLERRVEILEALVTTLSDQVHRLVREKPRPDIGYPEPALLTVPPDSSWIPIMHSMTRTDPPGWPRPCGQVGVYLMQPPQEHQNASLEVLRVLVPGEDHWRAPTLHDEPRCSSCLVPIDPFSSSDLDYLSVMRPAPRSDGPASVQAWAPPTPKKRRTRRKPESDAVSSVDSPGSSVSDLPVPAFPAHTFRSREVDDDALAHLRDIAQSFGIAR